MDELANEGMQGNYRLAKDYNQVFDFIKQTKSQQVKGKLTRDNIISVVRGRDLVGVYWKGTSGREILFETSPKKADAIIKIFNAK